MQASLDKDKRRRGTEVVAHRKRTSDPGSIWSRGTAFNDGSCGGRRAHSRES